MYDPDMIDVPLHVRVHRRIITNPGLTAAHAFRESSITHDARLADRRALAIVASAALLSK
jgi:hypothetical protein